MREVGADYILRNQGLCSLSLSAEGYLLKLKSLTLYAYRLESRHVTVHGRSVFSGRVSPADRLDSGAFVAQEISVSERSADSARRSAGPDFQTRTDGENYAFRRQTSLHQAGTMTQPEICAE